MKYVFWHVLFQNYFHIYRFPTATKGQFKNRLDPHYDTLLNTNRTRGHFERRRQQAQRAGLGLQFTLIQTEMTNQLLVKDKD